MNIPPDTVMFATDDSEEGLADARGWIRQNGYTQDDVKLVKRQGQALVISKVEIDGQRGN